MSPMHTQEFVVFERIQERQHEVEQRRLTAPLRQAQTRGMQQMKNKLGTFFGTFGIRIQRVD